MLGTREKDIYGAENLDDICAQIRAQATKLGFECDFVQSNHEGDIIDAIHTLQNCYCGCILNAGAFSHYSYAIYDAVKCIDKPIVEVHMSNIFSRETFRSTSVIAPACAGTVAGFGANSYLLALYALNNLV